MTVTAPTKNILRVSDLTIEIGGTNVVDGVSFDVGAGEILSIVGESGCGKSLTAFALLRLLPDVARMTRGKIELQELAIETLSDREMNQVRGDRISIIFQEPTASLDPLATVGSQIAEALQLHSDLNRANAWKKAQEMLDAVGIPDPARRMTQYPFELSGGMCQRIMIAIALICSPSLIVADEPTTALDVTIQAQILDLMRGLVADKSRALVLITHDMGVVADMADRVVVMYGGQVAEIAETVELFARPSHPYTALLLASVPSASVEPKARLATVEGHVPAPQDYNPGCRFASRCPLSTRKCWDEVPPLFEVAASHRSACWHIDRIPSLRAAAA